MEADREVMDTGRTHKLEEWVPAAGGGRTFFSTRAPYRDHRGEVAGVIGISSDITELKKAEEALQEIREAERSRIARDLHDEVLQDLTYALQQVQLSGATAGGAPAGLREAGAALTRSVRGLRGAFHDLGMEPEAGGSFRRSVEALVELNRQMNPGCRLDLEVERGFPDELPAGTSKDLLRVVQEALANARRHSEADEIRIVVGTEMNGKLKIEVSDNGMGFDSERVPAGVGTKGMRERTRALGGDLEIAATPGGGTRVMVEVPAERVGSVPEAPSERAGVLLVDDHTSFRQGVALALEAESDLEIVGQVGCLAEARDILASGHRVDIAVVDLGLPDGSGFDVCRELRATSQVPIIILSARGEEADRVVGLELGADDYVVKPFSAREVIARIRAVLRRTNAPTAPAAGPLEVGEVRLDGARRSATLAGEPLELSRKEFDLLALLMQEAGSVVGRERLIDEVWDVNWFGSTKTLDVHVSGLRKKLRDDPAEPRYLHTVRGVGFRFAGADEVT